ncbi:MAG: hypothetical protein QNJ40_14935 [Xanthomonadales bacterium]|nr:hypothetical protein [Xanthomonadales bacterium]
MKREQWNTLIEIVGFVGIVGSLLFVGLQIRQEAAATRSATVLQLKDAWVQVNLVQATSPELAEAFETVIRDGWDASFRARHHIEGFYRTMIHNWSNAHYQYRNGTLDDNQWLPHQREIQASKDNPLIRRVWEDWRHVFDDEFGVLMDGVMVSSGE